MKSEELVPYNPISALLGAMKTTGLHMRVISLGLRNIKRDFRIIEEEDEEKLEKESFGNLFKVLHKQIVAYGQAAVPETERVVQNVKKVFEDYVDYVFKYQLEDEIVTDLKRELKDFKSNAAAVSENHETSLIELAHFEGKVVESLSKFNAVTERYKREMQMLEKETDLKEKKKILAAWDIMSLGLSVQVTREESETSKCKDELMRKTQMIRERNELRENIATMTEAIIIPSFRKYIASFKSIETCFSVTLDDLEKAPDHDIDNYFKGFFDSLHSRSDEVKDVCNHFIAAIHEAKTDLAA